MAPEAHGTGRRPGGGQRGRWGPDRARGTGRRGGAAQDYTLASGDNALYPLLHFVMDDLPTKSKAPDLDASNTLAALEGSDIQCAPMSRLMGLCIRYAQRRRAHHPTRGAHPPILPRSFIAAVQLPGPERLPAAAEERGRPAQAGQARHRCACPHSLGPRRISIPYTAALNFAIPTPCFACSFNCVYTHATLYSAGRRKFTAPTSSSRCVTWTRREGWAQHRL